MKVDQEQFRVAFDRRRVNRNSTESSYGNDFAGWLDTTDRHKAIGKTRCVKSQTCELDLTVHNLSSNSASNGDVQKQEQELSAPRATGRLLAKLKCN